VTLLHLVLSFMAAGSVAGLAWRARSLNRSGAVAATILGGTITATAGWATGTVLIAFFVTSSLLSRFTGRFRPNQGRNVARGSNRDALQVFANGGVALLCALAWALWREDWLLGAFAGSLATAAADTWATEIGAFSTTRPRLITSLKPVERGVSGAISLLGTGATIAGAVVIAATSALLLDFQLDSNRTLFAIAAAGIAGSLTDSLLGATIQVHYSCPRCNELTERTLHRCGTPTIHARGLAPVTNDTVNITAIAAGALIAAVLIG
jgi:uncharacterized protein (TIGR00297 family)